MSLTRSRFSSSLALPRSPRARFARPASCSCRTAGRADAAAAVASRHMSSSVTSSSSPSTSSSSLSSYRIPDATGPPRADRPDSISDQEWDLRAGRAVHTLRTNMPSFFETGLLPSVSDHAPTTSAATAAAADRAPPPSDSVYAPNIRLCYSPPATLGLPSPFPKSLQVEGLPLYHASATFVRHTLMAFYTDLSVELCKLQVRDPRGSSSPRRRARDIALHTRVAGNSRLSGARTEWDVHSTYTLSPRTALIETHVVESIHPAPHVTFFDGLRAALARLGLAGVDGAAREEAAGAGAGGAGASAGAVRGFAVQRVARVSDSKDEERGQGRGGGKL